MANYSTNEFKSGLKILIGAEITPHDAPKAKTYGPASH